MNARRRLVVLMTLYKELGLESDLATRTFLTEGTTYLRLIIGPVGAAPTAEPTRPSPTPIATWTRPGDGMAMVYVPAGGFQMGCESGGRCAKGEQPQYTVSLDAYYIDRYEVTNAQYAAFLNAMGNQAEGGAPWLDAANPGVRLHRNGEGQADAGYEDHPAVAVTWYGAAAYCAWQGGRLPSEAEWEKAARGPDARTYPWGDEVPDCSRLNSYSYDSGYAWATPCRWAAIPVGPAPTGRWT